MSLNLAKLEGEISANTDATLARQLFEEAAALEKSFTLGQWKYSQLEGGRFCEVAARVIYGADSGSFNRTKPVEECLKYIEDDKAAHGFSDRQALQHIAKVIKAAYKLRSQRGAIHVTPKYTADEIDSRLVIECARWTLGEICRLFGGAAKNDVAELIVELSRYPVALARVYGSRRLIQATQFTTEEEVLLLLHFDNDSGMSLKDIIASTPKDQSGVRKAITRLRAAGKREVVAVDAKWVLTDLGAKRVRDIMLKLDTT